jgi:hypothetical protein
VEEAFWRTTIADIDPRSRPASKTYVGGWRDYIKQCEIDVKNSNRSSKDARRAADTIRVLKAMDSEDMRFAHLVSSELSAFNPEHRGDFCSILGSAPEQHAQYPLFTAGRNFCTTQRGHMGLVPAGTKTRDVVAILSGATTPHVLRRVVHTAEDGEDGENSYERYQLVGEAYMHGMMDGEMFAGGPGMLTFMIV